MKILTDHYSAFLYFVTICLCLTTNVFAAGDAASGKTNYDKLCMSCHGVSGAGDGPVGAALPQGMKPASFKVGAFKYASDSQKFKELITKGGAAVGLNALMPPQAGLSDKDLEDLYAYVLSLKQ